MRQARIAGAAASRRVEGIRHCSEDLEPQVETGKTEKLGEQGRRGSQAQDTAKQGGAAAGADQHGKAARIAEARPRQVDDDLAGMRPQQVNESLAQAGRGSDFDVAADCRDGMTTLTADGKSRAKVMIDFGRPPSPAAYLGSGRNPVVTHSGRRRRDCRRARRPRHYLHYPP